MSDNILPIMSSMSFLVSCLKFQFVSHFEFIFVYGVRVCSNFINLHVAVQLSQNHLLERPFPIVSTCLLCQRLINHRCVGLFLGPLFCPIDSYICFVSTLCCLVTQLYVLSEVWRVIPPTLFLLLRIALVILDLSWFQ